jgi:sodium/proline symporter
MNAIALISFILYFIVVLAIGIYANKFSSKGMSEFFLGGRQMNSFVIAISSVVSGRGTWLLLVFSAQSYTMGISAIWAVAGYIIVEFLLFLFYAPRLRTFTEKNNSLTLIDFYASRFRDGSGSLRLLLSIIFIVLLLTYISAWFLEGGKAFYINFGLNQSSGIILIAVIVFFYTILGGFLATNLIDVLTAFFILLAIIIIPVYIYSDLGGSQEVQSRIAATGQEFFNPFALSCGALISFLGSGLGSAGNIQILVKYMSVRNPGQFKKIAIIGTLCSVLLAVGAMMIGIMAKIYFPNIESLPGKDAGNAFLTVTHAVLPPVISGFVIASVFSAIISTADTQLLVATSTLVRDLYEKIICKKIQVSQGKLIFLSRAGAAILVYLALLPGLFIEKELSYFLPFVWALLGASIGPSSILSLFWKKTTRQGIFAGLISGMVTVIIWKIVPSLGTLVYELIPGFLIAFIMIIAVSLMTQQNSQHEGIKTVNYRKTWQNGTRLE